MNEEVGLGMWVTATYGFKEPKKTTGLTGFRDLTVVQD
jgi:hypothetical protein